MENLHVNLQENPASIDQNSVVIQKPPKGKKLRCDFVPRKSLEEVLVDLKDKILIVINPEPIQVGSNEIDIKKQARWKKQRNPYINFKNKRPGQLISQTLRNRQRDFEKPIPMIKVDDQFFEDDIDDRIHGDDTDVDTPQFDFVSNIPPFLNK